MRRGRRYLREMDGTSDVCDVESEDELLKPNDVGVCWGEYEATADASVAAQGDLYKSSYNLKKLIDRDHY